MIEVITLVILNAVFWNLPKSIQVFFLIVSTHLHIKLLHIVAFQIAQYMGLNKDNFYCQLFKTS